MFNDASFKFKNKKFALINYSNADIKNIVKPSRKMSTTS